jgi:hypothetical protein
VLTVLESEIRTTLALLGQPDIPLIDSSYRLQTSR